MAQSVNLSVGGINTSGNDFNGLPPGCLTAARNVESRYKNTLEPRRGFNGLAESEFAGTDTVRMINFPIAGTDRLIALTAEGNLFYYNAALLPADPWVALPGNFATDIDPPDAINGKSRFVRASQNLYLTAADGVRSLSSGSAAEMIRAGVPKGLNLEAETNGDTSGFFDNNTVLTTTGNTTNGGAI